MTGQRGNFSPLFSPQRVVPVAILFFAAAAVALHLGQAAEFRRILQQSRWWWIAAATLLQMVFLINQSALYHAAYRMARLPAGFGRLLELVISAAFVSAVVPGGTISGTGLMVYDAVRRGQDAARAVLASVIFYIFDYLAFLVILLLALFYLFSRGNLQFYELAAAAVLAGGIGTLLLLLLLLTCRPVLLANLAGRLARTAGRLSRKVEEHALHWEEKAGEITGRLSDALQAMIKNRPALLRAAIHALLVEGIGLMQLQALFLAFGGSPGAGRLITGYAVGVLFMIVSVTPQGAGLMEGAMTAAYTSTGIPLEQAVLVTFTYRVLSLWLPTIGGFIFFKRTVNRW
ncbi:lysylphosphatidylglycerol synthase transmembrane domain-containing protein [Desulfofundulus thermocisternus]|uniref:lysylphosphatidylglycerol synthase transmembrane domain-containing protein n=1 Tax=Desulfofundulus thermocisternus TaxID=42471 RepID=UPI000485DDBD|nr:lysylphosphatidylglycerol synthase transmembrane domain-containing protein [Desulfofundulus thermocisternus]